MLEQIGVTVIYLDAEAKRGGKHLREREQVIMRLRAGDRMVVAFPSGVGTSRTDILGTIGRLGTIPADIHVASTGETVRLTSEAKRAIEFVAEAESELMRQLTARMRTALKGSGARAGRKPALDAKQLKALQIDWDNRGGRSANEVAASHNISVRTLYRLVEKKGEE